MRFYSRAASSSSVIFSMNRKTQKKIRTHTHTLQTGKTIDSSVNQKSCPKVKSWVECPSSGLSPSVSSVAHLCHFSLNWLKFKNTVCTVILEGELRRSQRDRPSVLLLTSPILPTSPPLMIRKQDQESGNIWSTSCFTAEHLGFMHASLAPLIWKGWAVSVPIILSN